MSDEPAFVATLIANPAAPCLSAAMVADLARLAAGTSRILADGIAADLPAATADDLKERLVERLDGAPVDVVVQKAAGRRKRLLLADMDSTMIEQECIDELAAFVGLKAEVAAITERAMLGEIAFEPALRNRVALLRGLSVLVVDRIVAERLVPTAGGRALVATMKRAGAHTCLVSGGFTLFTGPIGRTLAFAEDRANRLVLEGDTLAGTVAEPILGREAKRDTLLELRARLGLGEDAVLAVGDGANDLAMLAEAGLGVAFRAKPAVAAAAHARIDHGDLTGLLYLQGYTGDEIVVE